MVALFLHSCQHCVRFLLSPHLCCLYFLLKPPYKWIWSGISLWFWSTMTNDVAIFSHATGYLCTFFRTRSIQILCPFFNWVIYPFVQWVVRVLYIFWTQVSYQVHDLQVFSPCGCPFHFLDSVLWNKTLNWMKLSLSIFSFGLCFWYCCQSKLMEIYLLPCFWLPRWLSGKESAYQTGDACQARDVGLNPGLGRSPVEGNGNLLQYSCLGNPMDRGIC